MVEETTSRWLCCKVRVIGELFALGDARGWRMNDFKGRHIPLVHGVHRSRAGYISQDRYEREADCFAAGLLMPEAPVCEVIGR